MISIFFCDLYLNRVTPSVTGLVLTGVWKTRKSGTGIRFSLTQIVLASVYCIKKTLDSRAQLFKNLPDSQKFTDNQYIQQQLKQSLKRPESISAF